MSRVSAGPQKIVVIGGGPAGTFAAIAARQQNPDAAVTLLTDEQCEPYEKPPLSKAVLLGKAQPGDALIAGPGGLASRDVHVEPSAVCAAIDRAARTVKLHDGRQLPYDALVIATGSVVREIPQLPLGTPRVHYLRTDADAQILKASLRQCHHLLVIGGGLIGLEVAASAAELGVRTTVVEMAPRILARVCDEETSAVVHEAHRQHGVTISVNTALVSSVCRADAVETVTSAGDVIVADLVVVGTGVAPNVAVAAAAGLTVDDGIVVDECCRTSDPAIFAAGDVVRFPGPHGPVRLENWRHALDHGTAAGRNAAGARTPYVTVPSFWSEQYRSVPSGGWLGVVTRGARAPADAGKQLADVRDQRRPARVRDGHQRPA